MSAIKTSGHAPKNTGLSQHLAGWWKLDEGSGIVLADSSGRGNHMSAPVALSGGFWGTAGRGTFNGTSDRFHLHAGKFRALEQLAKAVNGVLPSVLISCRLKVGIPTADSVVFSNKGRIGNQDGVQIALKPTTGKAELAYAASVAASKFSQTTTPIASGVDVHLVIGISRTDGKLYWYKDGVMLNEEPLGADYPDATALASEECGLSIGNRGFGIATAPFTGQLWDVQLYRTFAAMPLAVVTAAAELSDGAALTRSDW